jgi:hypothetical protein
LTGNVILLDKANLRDIVEIDEEIILTVVVVIQPKMFHAYSHGMNPAIRNRIIYEMKGGLSWEKRKR